MLVCITFPYRELSHKKIEIHFCHPLDYLCLPRVMASVISVARNRIGLRFFFSRTAEGAQGGGRASEEVPCLVERVHKKRVGMRSSNRAAAADTTQRTRTLSVSVHPSSSPHLTSLLDHCLVSPAAGTVRTRIRDTLCLPAGSAALASLESPGPPSAGTVRDTLCLPAGSTAIVRVSLCLTSLLTSAQQHQRLLHC